jgi:sugar phosphate isomerase/epimerase
MHAKHLEDLTRRQFLGWGLAGTGALLLGRTMGQAGAAEADRQEPTEGGFRLGLQSYSLRQFSFDDCLARSQELILRYVEAFPGHLPDTADAGQRAAIRDNLARHKIQLLAYGVVGFGADDSKNRALFEFAKAVGIRALSADPAPDSFDSLSRLVEEFGVNIAIHNHGPGHRYATEEDLRKVLEGRPVGIGVCLDTGHLARAGGDSVRLIRALPERIHGVHLKDVNAEKNDVDIGTGVLPIRDILQALRDARFKGCLTLEYELQPDAPLTGIRKSLDFVRKTIAELKPAATV